MYDLGALGDDRNARFEGYRTIMQVTDDEGGRDLPESPPPTVDELSKPAPASTAVSGSLGNPYQPDAKVWQDPTEEQKKSANDTFNAHKPKDNLMLSRKKSSSRQRSRNRSDAETPGDDVDELLGKWTTLQLDPDSRSEPARKRQRRIWGFN